MIDQKILTEQIKERFDTLPKSVQDAITSADVQAHLRRLADTHKLHYDQWQVLENEVIMTLLGLSPMEDLRNSLVTQVGVDEKTGDKLARDISLIVFQPIREELERGLAHPKAQPKLGDPIEDMTESILKDAAASTAVVTDPSVPPVTATPIVEQEKPAGYTPGEVSADRKDTKADPYRESVEPLTAPGSMSVS
ncbi:MAG: hypothetical protein AAB421_03785 [Patescibacteria group bacterium]